MGFVRGTVTACCCITFLCCAEFGAVLSASENFEGLVLLKRYAAHTRSPFAAEVSPNCAAYGDWSAIETLPVTRSADVVAHILARPKPAAIVFDFDNGGGFGSCVFGFVQAFHWAVRSGLPLLVLRPTNGNVNAAFAEDHGVFQAGFPLIDSALVAKLGFSKLFKPTETAFKALRADPFPFKVATFRSMNSVSDCMKDAFVSPDRPTGRKPHSVLLTYSSSSLSPF